MRPAMTAVARAALALVIVAVMGCGGGDDQPGGPDANVTPPALPSWELAFDGVTTGINRSVIALPGNFVLVPGGATAKNLTNLWLLFDIDARTDVPFTGNTAGIAYQSKTPLQDGRVLLAGLGAADQFEVPYWGVGPECYLVDPQGPTVTATGTLNEARSHHDAALLDDGRVLVAGGAGDGPGDGPEEVRPPLASAELYDPATGTWAVTGSMAEGRYAATATRLPDGRVLVAGGIDAAGTRLASVEIYDPATSSFSAAAPMSTGRAWHIAAPLPSGKVLVAGGQDSASSVTASAEVYDPASDTWTDTGPLPLPAADSASLVLPVSGLVLVTGGYARFDSYETMLGQSMAAVYEESAGRFWPMDPIAPGRYAHSMVRLSDDRVVLVAGRSDVTGPGQYASEIVVTIEPMQ